MNFRTGKRRRNGADINLTPLIDIVFNLLIFFLITTTFVQNPGIEVELPKASTAPDTAAGDNVVVAITREGRYIHEGQAMAGDELEDKLRQKRKTKSAATTVLIQADEQTPHGRVVAVMDLVRKVGFGQVAIATEAATGAAP